MSNVIQIKHGTGRPSDGTLAPHELGHGSDGFLYIGGQLKELEDGKFEYGNTEEIKVGYASLADKANGFTKDAETAIKNIKVDKAGSADYTAEAQYAEQAWSATNATNATNAVNIQKPSGNGYDSIKQIILDSVYPVGAIYMSTSINSPQNFLGGTWEPIEGQFLLAANGSYKAGTTGGSTSYNIETKHLPSHVHTFTGKEVQHDHSTFRRDPSATSSAQYQSMVDTWGTGEKVNGFAHQNITETTAKQMRTDSVSITPTGEIGATGEGEAIKIIPPYLAVYMWKRTA